MQLPHRSVFYYPLLIIIVCLQVACSTHTYLKPQRTENPRYYWQGRLSVYVESRPVKQFHASYILSGTPTEGQLQLNSPFGNTIAIIRWNKNGAILDTHTEQTHYPSTGVLIKEITGADISIDTLFDWLQGRSTTTHGWEIDYHRFADGMLLAKRQEPQPFVTIKIVLH
jgi:outer membrane lipoprotein LolB